MNNIDYCVYSFCLYFKVLEILIKLVYCASVILGIRRKTLVNNLAALRNRFLGFLAMREVMWKPSIEPQINFEGFVRGFGQFQQFIWISEQIIGGWDLN